MSAADTRLVARLAADALTATASSRDHPTDVAAAAELALSGADSSDPVRAHARRVALVGCLAMAAVDAIENPRASEPEGTADRTRRFARALEDNLAP